MTFSIEQQLRVEKSLGRKITSAEKRLISQDQCICGKEVGTECKCICAKHDKPPAHPYQRIPQ